MAISPNVKNRKPLIWGIVLLIFTIVIACIALSVFGSKTLPNGYRIESFGSGQFALVDKNGRSPVPNPYVEYVDVIQNWIIVREMSNGIQDFGSNYSPTYYLVDSSTGHLELTSKNEQEIHDYLNNK